MKTLGFIGTGAITRAVIEGLNHKRKWPGKIIISPRSEVISAKLAEDFEQVSVGSDNQAVVDGSDVVCLAVRPQIAQEVVCSLRFRPGQEVVSFIAATPRRVVTSWIDQPVRVTQAVPLPFVSTCRGATVIYPRNEAVSSIFDKLGATISVEDETSLNVFFAASALMGIYFGMLETSSLWLQANGLDASSTKTYLTQLFSGLSHTMMQGEDYATERHNHSTKGGLNEQLYRVYMDQGGGHALEKGLDSVLARLSQ